MLKNSVVTKIVLYLRFVAGAEKVQSFFSSPVEKSKDQLPSLLFYAKLGPYFESKHKGIKIANFESLKNG